MLKIYEKNQIPLLLELLDKRARAVPGEVAAAVDDILRGVRSSGDAAVYKYCKEIDKVELDSLYLSDEEKEKLISRVPQELRDTIQKAAANIYAYHERQRQQGWTDISGDIITGQRVIPLRRVGLYVPGGTAAYPSSVLMNAIPAQVAGVREIIMATPPRQGGVNSAAVYAAEIAGINNILTVGGAQAIAALAYGTESVKRVDKIVGPGNVYVSAAKRMVFGEVDIDMFAGPSEVLVIADESARPDYIAADLMSQAEHDELAASILVTTSAELAHNVAAEIQRQIMNLKRREIIEASIKTYGAAVIVDNLKEAAALSDIIAPEHLELAVVAPFELLGSIHNAGSVFLGHDTPEPLGDYYAGPNHVLPTSGTARFSSGLSVDSFIKKSSFLYYGKQAFQNAADDVARFAISEGLDAHANAIKVRMDNAK